MAEHAQKLSTLFRNRPYGELVLTLHEEVGDESLSDETQSLLDRLRPQLREQAEGMYEVLLAAPRARPDFFRQATQRQYETIIRLVKRHYLGQHHSLITNVEALALTHIVTMNFARLCGMNQSFKERLSKSRHRNLMQRLRAPVPFDQFSVKGLERIRGSLERLANRFASGLRKAKHRRGV